MNIADHIANAIAAGFEVLVQAVVHRGFASLDALDSFIKSARVEAPLDFAMFDVPAMSGSQLLRDIARSDRRDARRLGVSRRAA